MVPPGTPRAGAFGPLGVLLSPPALDVRLMTALQVLQVPFLGIGPPQAAWRGAVERPSGGPSAPGRRCWRLGRNASVAFFKLGAHSATLRPEFGGP